MSGALRELLAKFTTEVDTAPLERADKMIEGLRGTIGKLGGLLAGAAVVGGIKEFIGGLADAGDQINDTSAQLGLGTDEFQQWGLAAKLSGAEAGDFSTAVKLLEKNMAEGAKAGSPQAASFKKLGVELKDAGGHFRDTGDVLAETGIAISKLGSPAERTQAALELFGKAGTKLLPMFADGEEGLQGLLAEFHKLGGGYSEDALKQMGRLGDETDKYNFALTSLKSQIALVILPRINDLISRVSKTVGTFKLSEEGAVHLKTAFITLGAVGAVAGAAALAPWVPMLVLMAGLYLLVDDVTTAMRGGDSISGRLIDKLFGKGTGKGSTSVFHMANEDLKDLNREIAREPPGGRSGIEITIDRIGAGLKKVPAQVAEAMGIAAMNVAQGSGTLGEKIAVGIGSSFQSTLSRQFSAAGVLDVLTLGVTKDLAKVQKSFEDLGRLCVEGFTKGLIAGTPGAKSASEALGKQALISLGLAVVVNSPSVAAMKIGSFVGQGLTIGMHKETANVKLASAMMVAPVIRAMAPLGSQGARSVQQSYSRPSSFSIVVQGGSASSVREGLGGALDDDRNATLAALEALA